MSADFDLNILPVYRIQGQELPQIPGLFVVAPPKRVARGRKDEALLIYLTLSGTARFSSAEYNHFISKTTQRFYQTSGTLTSAMRSAIGELNQFLLDRNLHTTGKGEYIIGRLILGVLRGTQFVFAQCGPMHIVHLTGLEARQIHDDQIAGRGLGISQTAPLYFSQVDLHQADMLVLFSSLSAGWDTTQFRGKSTSFEIIRRKLLGGSSDDVNAVLVQVRRGKGNLNIFKGMQPAGEKLVSTAPAAVLDVSTSISTPLPAIPTSQVDSGRPGSRFAHLMPAEDKSTPPANRSNSVLPSQSAGPSSTTAGQAGQTAGQTFQRSVPIPAAPVPGRFVSPRSTTEIPEIKRPPSRRRRAIFGGLARAIQGGREGTQSIAQGTKKILPKFLPNAKNGSEAAIPSLALFTIIIPVIIVAIAVTVYIHYGRSAQYQQYYNMALTQASQAHDQKNPTEVRRAWESALYYLDLAEKKQKTQASDTLRQEAQTALDNLDGILRLDFRPAIAGGLSQTVQISRMVATDTDLYLLDSSRGNIIRAAMLSQSYEVDSSFKCDPGQYGLVNVGALVDMVALPMTNLHNARILAIDSKGNLLYCGLADPVAVSLVPPQFGLRGVSAFSLSTDGESLYVLDPAGNAVWQYAGNVDKFADLPNMFFGQQVPQNMNTAIDLAVNDSDLYMLFKDGHVTSCPLNRYQGVPMRCADPAAFVDTRPERQSGPKINDAIFTQMTFASTPDPSLYMLEPLTRAIYRLSPRSNSLDLRGQFRATIEENNALFTGSATAMTISPNHYAFLGVGNLVYFATDVP